LSFSRAIVYNCRIIEWPLNDLDAIMDDKNYTEIELAQKRSYDATYERYLLHYTDEFSRRYYRKFFNKQLTDGVELAGKKALEALSGSGQLAGVLIEKGADVFGLDISPGMAESFTKRWPGCGAVSASIFDCAIKSESIDCVFIMGGLHHLHPHVGRALDEIHRILKQGGWLCFGEPHAGSLPDVFRRAWYRADRIFERSESAIDLDALRADNERRFDIVKTQYMGGVAYLAVLNSMVFRAPLWLKRAYAPPLMLIESLLAPLCGKRLSCFSISQWRKI